jgi:PGAP1-like protein
VVGVSADGVTQALVAIPANNIGDVVQLSLINDAGSSSSSSDQDGGLMPLQGNPNSLSNNQNLVAIDPGNGQPIAFAIYRAPTNYARGTQNFPQDNTSTQRQVSFQVICPATNGSLANPTNTSVTVVRPPVVLVHGLWVDPKTVATIWSSFAPTAGSSEAQLWSQLDQNPGEQIFWADYSASVQVGSIVPSFTNPLPPFNSISQVSGSALGFQFNAPIVLSQVQKYITTYANDLNVAAVQADVIAHSMGGNIVRTMAVPNESWNFLTNGTYGQGPIEKLITIGTPHLGSPLAVDLLPTSSGQDPNSCVRNTLAFKTVDLAFQSANVAGNSVNGGVNDLVGDGQDTFGLSLALQSLQASQRSQPFPMAYLAGTESQGNLAHLSSCSVSGCTAAFINSFCGGLFGNPLANDLTTNNWPNVFGGNASDGIVPLKSQLNGASAGGSPGGGGPVTNIIHSAGLYSLDFIGFNDLNSSTMAGDAMDLLNEAKNGPDYQ